MENFKYLGKTFKPLRSFTKYESKKGLGLPLLSTGISSYHGESMKHANHISDKWNYNEFYKVAKVGAAQIDVFEMDGKEVVPCSNELFYLNYDL